MKERLNILQINTHDFAGGAARVARDLYQAYRQLGHESWLAVGYKQSENPNILVIPNNYYRNRVTRLCTSIIRRLDGLERRNWGVLQVKRILYWLAGPLRRIREHLGIEEFAYPGVRHLLELLPVKPDIIHCHNLHGRYFDLKALTWLSHLVPTILTLHDAWLLSGHCAHSFDCQRWKIGCGGCPDLNIFHAVKRDATSFNWRRKQKIYSKSRLYVATPCRWLMEKVEQSSLAPAILERKIIPYGIDLEVFHPRDQKDARRELGLPQNADILLFASHAIRYTLWRDYSMIEDAIKRLSQTPRPQPLIMICLGEVGDSKRFGNAEICFVPFQKDPKTVAHYYRAADVYLHPSKADTFPNSILEALACGRPVVSTAVGGIPEMVEEGKNGFLVPHRDVELMAERVGQLLCDKNLWRSFSQRAVEVARQRFDFNHEAETYLNWYKEILTEWRCR